MAVLEEGKGRAKVMVKVRFEVGGYLELLDLN